MKFNLLAITGMTVLLAAQDDAGAAVYNHSAEPPQHAATNPLLAIWLGPYGGVPPFDKARVEHLKPALIAGMDQQLAEIEQIAANPAAPTFENTLAALERSGRALDRAS